MSQATSVQALPETAESMQEDTISSHISSSVRSISPAVFEAVGKNLPAMANITLTDEHIAVIANIVTQTLQSQTAAMVSSIVDGVLCGLKEKISSLEDKNTALKDRIAMLEVKVDKAEQYIAVTAYVCQVYQRPRISLLMEK